MSERAVIFGREADTYDMARPTYPAEAIAHINALVEAVDALEVGAGTGKATVDIARPDLRLTCLEPSPEMAQILAEKELPGVNVVVSTFEEWEGDVQSIDLIYAAQAWHWVDTDIAYDHALRVLRPRGALALMWNVPLDRYEMFDEVYARHAPDLAAIHDERIKKRDSDRWLEDMEQAGFEEVERFTHAWSDTLDARQLRALYSTYSDHMMLPDQQRGLLLDGLAGAVDRMGGHVDIAYRTNVFTGRARG